MKSLEDEARRYTIGVFEDKDYQHTDYYSVVARSTVQAVAYLRLQRKRFKVRTIFSVPVKDEDYKEGEVTCLN